jgi:integrase/recombinase XerC
MTNKLATIDLSPMGENGLPELPSPGDLIDMFLSGRNPRTMAAYGKDLDDFARFLGAPDRRSAVESILSAGQGPANAWGLAWRNEMAGRGLTPATIARRLAALRSVVKLARTVGRVSWGLDVAAPKPERYRDTRGPGHEGWLAMLAAAERAGDAPKARRDRAIVRLLHDRGLRRGEVVGLDLADLDLADGSVNVVGKGRTQAERLTIGDGTARALAEWVAARGEAPGPLFVRLDPGRDLGGRLTGKSVRLIVAAIGKAAGLDRVPRPHGLRHQAITRALDLGRDLRDVARFSRHRDVRTLMIYDDSRRDVGGDIAKMLGD